MDITQRVCYGNFLRDYSDVMARIRDSIILAHNFKDIESCQARLSVVYVDLLVDTIEGKFDRYDDSHFQFRTTVGQNVEKVEKLLKLTNSILDASRVGRTADEFFRYGYGERIVTALRTE